MRRLLKKKKKVMLYITTYSIFVMTGKKLQKLEPIKSKAVKKRHIPFLYSNEIETVTPKKKHTSPIKKWIMKIRAFIQRLCMDIHYK